MADNLANKSAAGVTPAKLALVAVLSVTLLAVLYVQFGPMSSDATTAPATARASRRPAARNSASKSSDAVSPATPATVVHQLSNLSRWHAPDLAVNTQYDPFALPAAFPQPRSAGDSDTLTQTASTAQQAATEQAALEELRKQMRQRLNELRHQGVHVIVKSRDEYVAVIGDKEIRVGDEINGFTVVAINSDGVQVVWERNE